jgi:hypothetical protein
MGVLNNQNRAAITIADIQTDAKRKLELIRAFIAEFSDGEARAELTSDELRIATRTLPSYLRKGAVVADTQPLPGYPPGASHTMRIGAEADEAYKPVIVALADATRLVTISVARLKLEAADAATIVRNVAVTYSRTPQGAGLRQTVEEMRTAQTRPPRRTAKKKSEPEEK